MRDFGHYFNHPLIRYRLLAGFTVLIMAAVYFILENRMLNPERLLALVVLAMFAAFGWQRFLGRWPHGAACLAFLPMLGNICMQMYATALSQDFLVKIIAVHVLMAVAYSSRSWLRLHMCLWTLGLIGTAFVIPDPQIQPLTVTALVLFMTALVYIAISGMIRNREKLNHSELLLAQSQALAKVGGWKLTVASGDIELTDSAWEMLGIPAHARHRFDAEEYFATAEEFARFVAMVDEVEAHGGPLERQVRLRKADGSLIWAQVRATSQRDTDGVLKVLGVFSDVTEALEREEELRAAIDTAEQASLARTRFLANMSHEIRTPMNGVIGMTSLLMESNLPEQERGYVEVIRASGDSLLNIINEILDFSKYEAGQLELENESFSMEDVVAEVLDIVSTLAENKGLKVYLDAEPFPVEGFVGDVSKIRQVLVNLMSNAIKFTEEGSVTLTFCGEAVPDGVTDLTVSVTDTGIGIAEEALPSLFNPFMQEDASIARRFGGTGLGLAISREIVSAMGGELAVQSRVGEGSTFRFTIPLQTGPRQALPQLPNSRAQICILTADDVCADILARKVKDYGGKPTVYTRADEIDFNKVIDVLLADLDVLSAISFASLRAQLPSTRMVALARVSQRVPKLEANTALLRMPVRHRELWEAMQPADESRIADDVPQQLLSLAPLRILLAEDNSVNQKVALQMLRKIGYGADVASDGLQALALVRQQHYDVVFMDLQMPEMDGLEATSRIRAMSEIVQPYIVAMTANALSSDREECADAGMNDFVPKPVRIGDIQAALVRASSHVQPLKPTAEQAAQPASGLTYRH